AHQNSNDQENSGNSINCGKDRPTSLRGGPTLRKYHCEMQQQRGLQQSGYDGSPINFPVKRGELARILKRVKDKGDQTKNVEVYRACGVPTTGKNEESDKKVQHAHNAQIIFNRRGPGRRLDYELYLKFLATPLNLVMGQ